MDALILQKIQKDLRALLEQHVLKLDKAGGVNISFLAPDKDFIAALGSTPTVNCYLIGLAEDTKRRQSEPRRTRLNESKTSRTAEYEPRFVDISYMITVWCRDKTSSAEIEHLLLGYLITGLGGSDFFPGPMLTAPHTDASLYGVRMQLFGSEYADKVSGQVWQAMGATPKPCLMLSLSVPVAVKNTAVLPVAKMLDRASEQSG
ncbi:hypothetical protein VA7868_02353 [Vibrio aerogenes CECT 7868]|uniref:Pvc16 N-terminal domain-containing protein n=1 Tax=Vibrio aerogenes CECT 7868 TaxID=1216006 RepID=A0A1M5Z6J5_9VIBR|nr:DUF4255 domain-containing protein [Vibrio aerogenes]SHI19830.1 hypothetical protein VA7868_02353 [Vibrio aerogenes CECT 7868]